MAKPLCNCGISILAGGLSRRMGQDKARLRLGSRTLLGHIRYESRKLGLPVRVIRRDLVSRCGPLGGVYTALKTSQAQAELFLACDMPFVSSSLIEKLLASWDGPPRAAFITLDGVAGFPFVAPVQAMPMVERQIQRKQLSLQTLAFVLKARRVRVLQAQKWELFNINTPADWRAVRRRSAPVGRSKLRTA